MINLQSLNIFWCNTCQGFIFLPFPYPFFAFFMVLLVILSKNARILLFIKHKNAKKSEKNTLSCTIFGYFLEPCIIGCTKIKDLFTYDPLRIQEIIIHHICWNWPIQGKLVNFCKIVYFKNCLFDHMWPYQACAIFFPEKETCISIIQTRNKKEQVSEHCMPNSWKLSK